MAMTKKEEMTIVVRLAMQARTDDYWYNFDNKLYNKWIFHCILSANNVSHYVTENGVCFLTKKGYVEIGAFDNAAYANFICYPFGKFVPGERERLSKKDLGNEIIRDVLGDLLR